MIEIDIREASDEELIAEFLRRGMYLIKAFSDTELNNEISRRRHEAEKRYEEMMGQGLV